MIQHFRICLCGTQPGYQHPPECPYPFYHSEPSTDELISWETERNIKRINLMEPIQEFSHEEEPTPEDYTESQDTNAGLIGFIYGIMEGRT